MSIPTAAQIMARYSAMDTLTLQEFIEILKQDIARQLRQDRIVIELATGQEYEVHPPAYRLPHIVNALWVQNLATIGNQFTQLGYTVRLDAVEARIWISI